MYDIRQQETIEGLINSDVQSKDKNVIIVVYTCVLSTCHLHSHSPNVWQLHTVLMRKELT